MSNESSSDDDVGPRIPGAHVVIKHKAPPLKRQHVEGERVISVDRSSAADVNLPTSAMYEFSFAHEGQPVTHLLGSPEIDFVVSISASEGCVKFWKKELAKLEFVKDFYLGSDVLGACLSRTGTDLAIVTRDNYLRVFDVVNFNMMAMVKVEKQLWGRQSDGVSMTFLGDTNSIAVAIGSVVLLFNISALTESPKGYRPEEFSGIHFASIAHIAYSWRHDCLVSADVEGFIEVWVASKIFSTTARLGFTSKLDTDLFELNKNSQTVKSLAISNDGAFFSVLTNEPQFVKVFRVFDGKLIKTMDETLDALTVAQSDPLQRALHLEASDFASRIGKELERAKDKIECNAKYIAFDESDKYLIYSTLVGVKIVDLANNALVCLLGKVESSERFTSVLVMQGKPKMKRIEASDSTGDSAIAEQADPWILCTSRSNSSRFYVFTKRMPDQFRDEGAEGATKVALSARNSRKPSDVQKQPTIDWLPRFATVCTTVGDMEFELFSTDCPRTVENFVTLAKKKYYDGLLFHRVIKGFMVQTGCPNGDGTGGESMWKSEFADEINNKFDFNTPNVLAMANHGPNTNASQFFVSTGACTWLNSKHTIFGKLVSGIETLSQIERATVDDQDKPIVDIRVVQIIPHN